MESSVAGTSLKRASKLRVCGLGLPDRGELDALPHTEAPCQVDLSHGKLRNDPRDLPRKRDVELMSVLERSPGLRGLAGVHAIEDEGLGGEVAPSPVARTRAHRS